MARAEAAVTTLRMTAAAAAGARYAASGSTLTFTSGVTLTPMIPAPAPPSPQRRSPSRTSRRCGGSWTILNVPITTMRFWSPLPTPGYAPASSSPSARSAPLKTTMAIDSATTSRCRVSGSADTTSASSSPRLRHRPLRSIAQVIEACGGSPTTSGPLVISFQAGGMWEVSLVGLAVVTADSPEATLCQLYDDAVQRLRETAAAATEKLKRLGVEP